MEPVNFALYPALLTAVVTADDFRSYVFTEDVETDDPYLISALDRHPAFTRVEAEDPADDPQPTDAEVLAAPGDYSVAVVLDVFSRATPEQIDACQALEAAGQNRVTIINYEPEV